MRLISWEKHLKNGVKRRYYRFERSYLGPLTLTQLEILSKEIEIEIRHLKQVNAHHDPDPIRARLKVQILALWKKHGKLNEPMVKKEIGQRRLRKYFGGMIPIYKELGIPLPKAFGKKGSHSDKVLLTSLRDALKKHGKLSKTINKQECIVQPSTYIYRFGSLPKAYQKVGYERRK